MANTVIYGNGFSPPTALGFNGPEIDNCLQMQLFPFHQLSPLGAPPLNFGRYMDVSEPGYLMGPNFQEMPGIILSCSLGAKINIPQQDNLHLNPGAQSWLKSYFFPLLNNIANHIYHNRTEHNWGGVCMYLDITQTTLFARTFNINGVLNLFRDANMYFSMIETQENIDAVTQGKKAVLDWMQGEENDEVPDWNDRRQYAQTQEIPLYYIAIAITYGLFRYFKHRDSHGDNWWREPPGDNIARGAFHDYNVRIYLIKRIGKLLPFGEYSGERDQYEPALPVWERNISPNKMWLSLAQYYRLMSCFMSKKQLIYNNINITLKTLRRFITRDAHASSTSSYSAELDTIFFNNAFETGRRSIMLGINPNYKQTRHAILHKFNRTWAGPGNPPNDSPTEYAPNTFGVLAGVCWYYNPSNEHVFCDYDIFKLPFQPFDRKLAWSRQYTVPASVGENDLKSFVLYPKTEGEFFSYGLDEYILSKFVDEQYAIDTRWEEINMLFYTIHWIQFIYRYSTSDFRDFEYYPLLINYFWAYRELHMLPRETLSQFMTRSDNIVYTNHGSQTRFRLDLNKILIHTLFGNADTVEFMDLTKGQLNNRCPDNLFNTTIQHYGNLLFNNGNQYNPKCILQNCHRYDRPFYWAIEDGKKLSNRPGNAEIIKPNNFSQFSNWYLGYVIRNPINRECGTNLCASDSDELGMTRCDDDAQGGGGKRKSKKHKLTRRKKPASKYHKRQSRKRLQ